MAAVKRLAGRRKDTRKHDHRGYTERGRLGNNIEGYKESMKNKYIYISIVLIFTTGESYAQPDSTWLNNNEHLTYGYPAYSDTVLNRQYFIIAYNRDYKIPEWVCYYLTPVLLEGTTDRTDDYRADPDLPTDKQAKLSDYSGSGYDRGHMAPAAAFKRSHDAMSTTFLLTNMTPQTPNLNRYKWKYLEDDVRYLVNARVETWVITGCMFLNENQVRITPVDYIGDHVYIPTHLYKAILTKTSTDEYEAYAFIMPNIMVTIPGSVIDYNVKIDSLETVSGLDFFAGLDDSTEDAIEAVKAAEWPITTNVDEPELQLGQYLLMQNYPNPFNPGTRIKYEIPRTLQIEITLYNILGQKIKSLFSGTQTPGAYEVIWDGTNESGLHVSSGIYIYRMQAGEFSSVKRAIFIK